MIWEQIIVFTVIKVEDINQSLRINVKTLGPIFTIDGLKALIYTGMNYIKERDNFDFHGADVTVSK